MKDKMNPKILKNIQINLLEDTFGTVFKIHSKKNVLFDVLPVHRSVLGIDPGLKNIGLAYVSGTSADIYEVELLKRETTIQIINSVWIMTDYLFQSFPDVIIVEGASYNDKYGQVSLETVRSAFVAWSLMRDMRIKSEVVPPKTIRKIAFGSGIVTNPWVNDDIPNNAAAALGCALYYINKGE